MQMDTQEDVQTQMPKALVRSGQVTQAGQARRLCFGLLWCCCCYPPARASMLPYVVCETMWNAACSLVLACACLSSSSLFSGLGIGLNEPTCAQEQHELYSTLQ